MEHPPVSPNCKRFQVIGTPCIHIRGDIFEHDRELVACFMRCAWLDESRKYKPNDNVDADWMRCCENAEAWRDWGKQE